MDITEITEEMVVQWLHREREGRGLKALTVSSYAAGVQHPEFSDVTAHAQGCCCIAPTVSEASFGLAAKIKQKKTQQEAANA